MKNLRLVDDALVAEGWTVLVREIGYGTVVTDGSKFPEWELYLTRTSRQDGKTAWAVLLTEVDGDVLFRSGLDRYAEIPSVIEKAIGELTREAGWLDPIN